MRYLMRYRSIKPDSVIVILLVLMVVCVLLGGGACSSRPGGSNRTRSKQETHRRGPGLVLGHDGCQVVDRLSARGHTRLHRAIGSYIQPCGPTR